MKIARVFPRKTTATPTDDLAFCGPPPGDPPEVDEVHISVTWSYDIKKAEDLAKDWVAVAPVKIGGPAWGTRGGEFEPGMYVKHGYVITSRGCPNKCWFCSVPKREGKHRELPIKDGWNVLDDNLLACSESHIRDVFKMLKKQPERTQFTGGLEAARLLDWHVNLLWDLRPSQMFFAYDTLDELEYLIEAGNLLMRADFTRRHLRCYVLIGSPNDNFDKAENRLLEAWNAGFMPMAMLWRNKTGETTEEWRKFQRLWARPAIVRSRMKEMACGTYKDQHQISKLGVG